MSELKLLLILVLTLSFGLSHAQSQKTNSFNSWEEVLKSKKGTVTVYWYTSKPFIFREANGKMAGIEYEFLEGFRKYVKDVYSISLNIDWVEAKSFYDTFEKVRATTKSGLFAASNFSITDERLNHVSFAPPYMTDISVLISSYDVPIVKNEEEFDTVFSGLRAISIVGTTYEKDLTRMKQERGLNFDIEFIPSSENILQTIEAQNGSFGYIDLPVYLTLLSRNAALKVKRQNLFPVKRNGYAVIYPKNSDWQQPLDEFFLSKANQRNAEKIIIKYLNKNVYDFIKNFYAETEDVILLTKEKEIQNEDLVDKSRQIEREAALREYLIVAIIVIGAFLMAIAWLYITKNKANILLIRQKEMIESQRKNIELQKQELEERNTQLELMDQEKNHIINILAHDLRAPISQITGLAQLMQLEARQYGKPDEYLDKIIDSTERLHQMITKILDVNAIETNRVNLSMEIIEVVPLVKNIVANFQKIANRKNLELNFLTSSETWVSSIAADKLYFTQVLENLISNAIKFSEPGKKVDILVKHSEKDVQISITDQGPGFTEADKKKLFRKFQILSARPTAGEQSTGLGLSIVKKYVEIMKGEVRCESTRGEGATFTLIFPNGIEVAKKP